MPRTRTYGLDIDTAKFAQRVKQGSGTTILPEPLKQINKFVVGVKKLRLWDSMICWPMRSIHNAGTGSTVYSLGGLGVFDGTLVNGPSWSADGIIIGNTAQHVITTGYIPPVLSKGTVVSWLRLAGIASIQMVASTRTSTPSIGGWSFTMRGLTTPQVLIGWNSAGNVITGNATTAAPLIGAGAWTYQRAGWQFTAEGRSVFRQSQNGTPQINSSLITNTAMGQLLIGNEPSNTRSLDGTMAGLFASDNELTNDLYSLLHSLFKRTLGTYLSLP